MTTLEITLNARLRPLDRGDIYEDPLTDLLDERFSGCEFVGAGTLLGADGEPSVSDIAYDISGVKDPDALVAFVVETLQSLGAPKGSKLQIDEQDPIEFGVSEGLALYLNGTDLPDEVYADNDVNELIAQLAQRLGGEGKMHSHWQGPRETALYFYGPSAQRMRERMRDVLDTHPLAGQSRLITLVG